MNFFDLLSGRAFDATAHVMGFAAEYVHADTGEAKQLRVLPDEFVGAIDDNRRALFTVRDTDFPAEKPARGDWFVLEGKTERWYVVNLRQSLAGDWELRTEGRIEHL
ncbi:MAG: hypothetical protein M9894_16145 [Planctomycetes bacterium]|nr:hypothetical protein [Planctomycetota bacterium]